MPPGPVATGTGRQGTKRVVGAMGNATVLGTNFRMGKDYIGSTVHILYDDAEILFFDSRGAEIISHPRPPKGTRYVGNGKPAGIMADPSAAVRKRKYAP